MAKRINNHDELDTTIVCYWKEEGIWWIYLPHCGAGMLSKHTITENADGTITVHPSVLMTGHDEGTTVQKHGYLEHGEWREV